MIVDLGLAKSVDVPLVPDGVSIVDGKAVGVGTPEYAAPEQFTGGDITPAADVHALGVLAEKLLGDQTRLRKWRSGILSASPLRRIIRRATSSIASERYQSVDAFAAAIRRRHWLRNGFVCLMAALFVVVSWWMVVTFVHPSPSIEDELREDFLSRKRAQEMQQKNFEYFRRLRAKEESGVR